MRLVHLALTLAVSACFGEPPLQQPAPADVRTSVNEFIPWAEARAEGIDFRAIGQEPGWLLDIYTNGQARLRYSYGEARAEFARVALSYPQEGATQYDAQGGGHRLRVRVQRSPCQDAMSGETFPARVVVTIDETTLEGCGKSV